MLSMQALGEAQALIERTLDGSVDNSQPLETYRSVPGSATYHDAVN